MVITQPVKEHDTLTRRLFDSVNRDDTLEDEV